jgi:hypothetical protein
VKTFRHRMKSRRGSALVTVLGAILVISVVAAGMVAVARQQAYSATRSLNYTKAQMYAEAGVNAAYAAVKTNFTACGSPFVFPLTTFDQGSYQAVLLRVGDNSGSITCTGRCKDAMTVVKVDVRNYPVAQTNNIAPRDNAYDYAIVAGGNLAWAGNADMQMSNGWMHCNGSFSANGNNVIDGNVSSHVQIGMVGGATIDGVGRAPAISGGTVTTPVVTNVPLVSVTNLFKLDPYYTRAAANSQVFSGTKSLSGTVTPPGGVLWVNGNLSFGNGTYTGCFIATGDIELKTTGNGTIQQTRTATYPLLVSRDGTITIKQTKTWIFRGLIYCMTGVLDKQGNGDVDGRGTIITAGNFSKNGGWSGMLYENCAPVPPGGNPVTVDKVVIVAWQ